MYVVLIAHVVGAAALAAAFACYLLRVAETRKRTYLAGSIVGPRDELISRLVEGAVGQRQYVRAENLQAGGEANRNTQKARNGHDKCGKMACDFHPRMLGSPFVAHRLLTVAPRTP